MALALMGCETSGFSEGATAHDGGMPEPDMHISQRDATVDDSSLPDADTEDLDDAGQDADIDDPWSSAGCASGIEWSPMGELAGAGRDHHMTFINARVSPPTLHVVGGTNYNTVFTDSWRAPILEDGALGEWAPAVDLPLPRSGAAVAQAHGRTYILGGRDRAGMKREVYASRHDPSGALVGWDPMPDLPQVSFHGSATATESHVYLTGGLDGRGNALPHIYVGALDADGEIIEWRTQALPEDRSHHSSFVGDGYLYLVHGFAGNPFRNQTRYHQGILRAQILEDGVLGPWAEVVRFEDELATHATTQVGTCAYVLAGLVNSDDYSGSAFALDWSEGAVEVLPVGGVLGTGRSHMHQVPFYDGRLYVVGGSEAYRQVSTQVEVGELIE
ncbi:MAG: hypothetical protein ACE366_30370 [Bradymonadia bacterium]